MAGFARKCPCLRPKIEQEVRVLDYRHSSLRDVPSEVFNKERTLEELYADSNQIRDLPRELFYCHGLRKLCVSDNEITSIPPAISSLANLEELDFSKNGVIDVPDNIKSCKYLRSIDASVNPLGKLPEGFTQLANLTHLYLNDTFLDYLPGSFGRMTKLRILEMRENHMKTLPRSFARLNCLERLDIGNNEFTELSDVIGGLTNLLELWCDNNQITSISSSIGQLKHLMFFDASKNQLQELPAEIEGCTSLADLHLTSNSLLGLPDSIGNLNNLTTLKADDNQLTSLPKTIGGLSSLSELNVSANDLEDLPASIGLLRNLRTFYADENFLLALPSEIGSCNGITVLSLRSNKLTYVPDEIGRIPRLRVLNLSDNQLQYLPFTIVKLKELQALWLTENQTRPLIPLQSEHEPDTGRKILTCYLLPQGEMQPNDERDPSGDTSSFHASMWDEERLQRQQIHFDFADDSEEEGHLVRCPTPYPKEMRAKVRHARNLAMRQMVGGGAEASADEGRVMPSDGAATERMNNLAPQRADYLEESSTPGFGYSKMSERADIHVKEARITSSASPSSPTHRLYRADKEKLIKDKARMQHRMSVPDFNDVSGLIKEPQEREQKDNPDSSTLTRRSGSVPDLSLMQDGAQGESRANGSSHHQPLRATTFDELYYKHIGFRGGHHHPSHRQGGRRARRSQEYDSDTGYRSDRDVYVRSHHGRDSPRGGAASSEILSVRSQPAPHSHHRRHSHGHLSSRGKGREGYASDIGPYSTPVGAGLASLFPTANAAAAAFQQNKTRNAGAASDNPHGSNSNLFQQPSSQPLSSSSPSVARSSLRAQSPSQPHGSHQPGKTDYDYHYHPKPYVRRTTEPPQVSHSRDRIPVSVSNQDYNMHYKNDNGNQSLQSTTVHQQHSNYGHNQQSLAYTEQSQRQPDSNNVYGVIRPPPVAPKPKLRPSLPNSATTNGGNSSPVPPSPGFHSDSFMDQSTPIGPGNPSASQAALNSPRDARDTGMYPLMEGNLQNQNFPSHHNSMQQTPPPYNPAPPYHRRPSDPAGASCGPRPRLSSDSSSGRGGGAARDSPRFFQGQMAPYPPYQSQQQQQQHQSGPNVLLSQQPDNSPLVGRSQSSPCGFHGSNPFPDFSTPSRVGEKLTFSDYADIDRRGGQIGGGRGRPLSRCSNGDGSDGSGRGKGGYLFRDNITTHSSSSSSQIGSASQVGPRTYNNSNNGSNGISVRPRDRSDSSDSRSDIHQFHLNDSSNTSYGDSSRQHLSSSFEHQKPHHQNSNYYEDLTHIMTSGIGHGGGDNACSQEQSSQVSSSTDSGYGPGHGHSRPRHPLHPHHVYESIEDHGSRDKGYVGSASPGSHASSAPHTPPSQRQTPIHGLSQGNNPNQSHGPPTRLSSSTASTSSREATPIKDFSMPVMTSRSKSPNHARPDPGLMEHRDQFRVTIKKNPGLGFSIAGGIGSHGNPYRPDDIGIFVTKVVPDGPASKHLRPGDKLLEVNKVNFETVEHKQAVAVLKTSSNVNLLVERLQKVNMV
ncbi:leucine-rich repeat-containing protein 7 [Elysia marginata]|uniref:Leucine-rich repeat-containing protein 7 n=1 Tax=Elysia marginata TaxID=1093978 RepID=A0AAV4GQJ1_9GAST|nr:leucine-rich repeat-containing protein 7 [Elysia marginata]